MRLIDLPALGPVTPNPFGAAWGGASASRLANSAPRDQQRTTLPCDRSPTHAKVQVSSLTTSGVPRKHADFPAYAARPDL
jgi:hypothetical protein